MTYMKIKTKKGIVPLNKPFTKLSINIKDLRVVVNGGLYTVIYKTQL